MIWRLKLEGMSLHGQCFVEMEALAADHKRADNDSDRRFEVCDREWCISESGNDATMIEAHKRGVSGLIRRYLGICVVRLQMQSYRKSLLELDLKGFGCSTRAFLRL